MGNPMSVSRSAEIGLKIIQPSTSDSFSGKSANAIWGAETVKMQITAKNHNVRMIAPLKFLVLDQIHSASPDRAFIRFNRRIRQAQPSIKMTNHGVDAPMF